LKKKATTILIFIILIATPILSVSGNDKIEAEKHHLNDGQEIASMWEYDDYQIGYWKFNENIGSTAHDSSGHNFDGTIYGASWTSGYYNYALDFDGVNDYVSLDNYAPDNLGFNKTDDLIFSLYFKTTQTTKGVMYSVSGGDYNPGFHIAINANGTIEIKVWRLSCGLLLTSEGVYNDGDWHHVEIWYNGIQANPTVLMYVDEELDISTTYYVCTFSAEMFTKAKIGTRSNDTENFFDGKIDDLKIIKFPGGNEQNPPEIEGPTEGEAGVEYDFSFTTYDPEDDEVDIYVDWGDGTNTGWIGPYESGYEVTLSHTYYENGYYEISAQSEDVWHFSSWSHHVIRIGDQPPDKPTISGPGHGDSKVEHEYTFKATDYEGGDVWYWIEWGDGEIDKWIGPYESGKYVKVKHSWDNKGIYEIKAKAKDTWGEGEWSDPHQMVIDNDPPKIPTISGPTNGKVGEVMEYSFTTTDPDGDNVYYYVYWDDGDKIENFGPYQSGDTAKISHKWDKEYSFVIKARARDIYDDFSENGSLLVIVPKSYNPFWWLNNLLERFPFLSWLVDILENMRK